MDIELKNRLKSAGVDVEGTLIRFMNNEALYEKFLGRFLQDENYELFCNDVATGNREEAIKHSHTLKGLTGNLGFSEMFEALTKIVALLREYEGKADADVFADAAFKKEEEALEKSYRKVAEVLA